MSVATRTAPGRPPAWLVPPGPRNAPPAALGTARTTGLLYLGPGAVAGWARVPDPPAPGLRGRRPVATLAKRVEQESLARLVVALKLGIVVAQAFVAVWFYRLFRSVDSVAAGSLAAFGLINAIVPSWSARRPWRTALDLALEPFGDATASGPAAHRPERQPLGGGRALLRTLARSDGPARAPFCRHAQVARVAPRRRRRRLPAERVHHGTSLPSCPAARRRAFHHGHDRRGVDDRLPAAAASSAARRRSPPGPYSERSRSEEARCCSCPGS